MVFEDNVGQDTNITKVEGAVQVDDTNLGVFEWNGIAFNEELISPPDTYIDENGSDTQLVDINKSGVVLWNDTLTWDSDIASWDGYGISLLVDTVGTQQTQIDLVVGSKTLWDDTTTWNSNSLSWDGYSI